MVDAILNVARQKGLEIVNGVIDSVVRNPALGKIVGTDFGRTVAGTYERFASRGYIVDILLMFFIVNKCTQTAECTLFIFWLVACFRTFDKDFIRLARNGVAPHISKAHTGFDLIDVLSTCATGAECLPFDFAFVDFDIKGLCLRQKYALAPGFP